MIREKDLEVRGNFSEEPINSIKVGVGVGAFFMKFTTPTHKKKALQQKYSLRLYPKI